MRKDDKRGLKFKPQKDKYMYKGERREIVPLEWDDPEDNIVYDISKIYDRTTTKSVAMGENSLIIFLNIFLELIQDDGV